MRPIFYLHIPKTGGQTLAVRLASAVAPDRHWVLRGDLACHRDEALLDRLLASHDVIEAHVSGPLLARPIEADILCTVREPIGRIVSSFLHVRREPRNRLHRAAHALPPAQFFRNYADHWFNQQARAVVEATTPLDRTLYLDDALPDWLHTHLMPALGRIRWLVPTEAIDEFILLWAREAGRHVPAAGFSTNLAPPDPLGAETLRRIVEDMPELYALDLDLWVRARRWMAGYRRSVLRQGIDPRGPGTQAFAQDGQAIWLTEGWQPPIRNAAGALEWWAGPGRTSRVQIRRQAAQALLVDIAVVNGIRREEIIAFAADDHRRLPCRMSGDDQGNVLRIELDGFGAEGEVLLTVPEVFSSIETSATDTDTTLRSFAGRNWRLA